MSTYPLFFNQKKKLNKNFKYEFLQAQRIMQN